MVCNQCNLENISYIYIYIVYNNREKIWLIRWKTLMLNHVFMIKKDLRLFCEKSEFAKEATVKKDKKKRVVLKAMY